MSFTSFDPTNGQIYTETWTAALPRQRKPWSTRTNGSTKGLKSFRNATGAAPLFDMAKRVLLVNLPSITAETLQDLPWTVGERLWRSIQQHDLVSVAIWQAFVKAYQAENVAQKTASLAHHAHSARIPSHALQSRIPSKALGHHLRNMTTPNLEWITILTIFDTPLSRHEWIQLSSLTNLGALYVQNSVVEFGRLDDVVIKAWSNAARETGIFPVLKFVLLRNQSGITLGTLEYFAYFPAIKVVHATGPTLRARDGEEAVRDSGWLWMSQSSLCLKLYGMWYAAESFHVFLKGMYDTVRFPGEPDGEAKKPLLQVVSGDNPASGIASRQDQLWFEMVSPPSKDAAGTKRQTISPANLSSRPKKQLKMKANAQTTTSLLTDFGMGAG